MSRLLDWLDCGLVVGITTLPHAAQPGFHRAIAVPLKATHASCPRTLPRRYFGAFSLSRLRRVVAPVHYAHISVPQASPLAVKM
jgi:hypothetical protein